MQLWRLGSPNPVGWASKLETRLKPEGHLLQQPSSSGKDSLLFH